MEYFTCPLCGAGTVTLIPGWRACTNPDCIARGKYPIPEQKPTDSPPWEAEDGKL